MFLVLSVVHTIHQIAKMSRTIAISLLPLLPPMTHAHANNSDLVLPPVSRGEPSPGLMVAITPPEYKDTAVHHMLYLPPNWRADWKEKNLSWPVIIEYTGNKSPVLGSTGRVENAALGFGISGGRFIWAVMPYVSADHRYNEGTWWGDVNATVEYAKINVPRICTEYGGNSNAVFICGFSRGAIAVNYIGLYDDDVAGLWRGFVTHDHYDGVHEWKGTTWGSPLDQYRSAAAERLRRLNGRPILVCHNIGDPRVRDLEDYLSSRVPSTALTFVKVHIDDIFGSFPNKSAKNPHTDRWMLKDSPARRIIWRWLEQRLPHAARPHP